MIIRRLRYYSEIESLRNLISQRMFAFVPVSKKTLTNLNLNIPEGKKISPEGYSAIQSHLGNIQGIHKGKAGNYLINGEVPTAEHWKGFEMKDNYLMDNPATNKGNKTVVVKNDQQGDVKTPPTTPDSKNPQNGQQTVVQNQQTQQVQQPDTNNNSQPPATGGSGAASTPAATSQPEPEYYKSWNDVYNKHGNMNARGYRKLSETFKNKYGERVETNGRKGYLKGDIFTDEEKAIQDFHKSKEGQEFFGNSNNFSNRGSVKYDSASGRYVEGGAQPATTQQTTNTSTPATNETSSGGSTNTSTGETATKEGEQKPGWWGRRSGVTKGLIVGGAGLAAVPLLANYNLSTGADDGTKYTEGHGGF